MRKPQSDALPTPPVMPISSPTSDPGNSMPLRRLSTLISSSRYRNLPIDPSLPVIPISQILCNPNRPGRKSVRQNALDLEPTRSFGDPIIQKAPDSVRIFFQNVKGLSSSACNEDYRYYLNCLQSLQVDIAGLAKTNTCWQHAHLREDFSIATRRTYRQCKVIYGSPSTECDPMPTT